MEFEEKKSDNASNAEKLVLVTGASGYLACHVINILLELGFKVRGTVRSLQNQSKIQPIYNINPSKKNNIELVEADLLNEKCWDNVVKGCYYVCHVASPFPEAPPKDEQILIKPAVAGTLNVLQAALNNGVKKVVMTSSIASVMSGHLEKTHFTEADFSIEQHSPPYEKSKLLAEKKAWEFFEQNKGKIKLTVINPALIMGPSFHANAFTSSLLVARILKNEFLGIPPVSFAFADVRDVAQAHVNALLREDQTNGKRYIICSASMWFKDVAQIIKQEFQPYGYKIPGLNIGTTIFKIYSLFDKQTKLLKEWVDRLITFDTSKSQSELGIVNRHITTTLVDMGHNLIKLGIVPSTKKYQSAQAEKDKGSAEQKK